MTCATLAVLLTVPLVVAAQTPVSRSYAVPDNVSMRIWVPSGSVRIDAWDRDSIHVAGTVGRGAHFFGGAGGQGAKIGIEVVDSTSTALASADLVVTVPRRAHVWVKTVDGGITVANTTGELEILTITGEVSVRNASSVVSVEAIDAVVSLSAISGEIRARTGGGKLVLAGIHGTLTVATVSGSVELTGAALRDTRVETIGGGITFLGTIAPDALLDLETHGGAIRLHVDRTALPLLALTSRAGMVTNGLGKGSAKAGRIVAHSFKGAINVAPMTGIESGKVHRLP